MGDPATPTAKDRAETRELAARIVESVRNDERMPLPGVVECYALSASVERDGVEQLAFQLAQEVLALQQERDDVLASLVCHGSALAYLAFWKGDDQHHANADEIAAGNMIMNDRGEAVRKEKP